MGLPRVLCQRGDNTVTRAFELQQWLRAHGPKTQAEIKAAGFGNFSGLTRDRMLKYGATNKQEQKK